MGINLHVQNLKYNWFPISLIFRFQSLVFVGLVFQTEFFTDGDFYRRRFLQTEICPGKEFYRRRFLQTEISTDGDFYRRRFLQTEICPGSKDMRLPRRLVDQSNYRFQEICATGRNVISNDLVNVIYNQEIEWVILGSFSYLTVFTPLSKN